MYGKTPAEVAVIAGQLAALARQAVTQPPQPPPSQPALGPDDYVTGAHLQSLVPQVTQGLAEQAARYAEPAINAAASLAYDRVKEKHAEVFAKYGPEINGHLAHVPKTQWNIDSLTMVVDLVRGRHVEEIAAERAARLAAQPTDPALRASGAGGTIPQPATDPIAGLSEAHRQSLARRGVSLRDVETFCAKQDPPMPVAKWFERYGQSAIGGSE